ncbi:MAG TPA: type VI secretion system tube protein Hcp [Pyrinomonadaceae bacterium]|nr:type VI secretion system tube protein Hcp [Pyrinomonadaceae bacterium]
MAAADYYLKIEGVDGESEAIGMENQIQIASWSWGASNSGSAGLGTGLGTGKASMQDFHFVCENGKATPQLFLKCATGKHIPEAILTCRKTGGNGEPYTYYKMTFKDIVISSFQEGGSGGSDMLPMCQISFNYTKITQEYFQQKKDGSVSLTNTVNYDTKKVQGSGA